MIFPSTRYAVAVAVFCHAAAPVRAGDGGTFEQEILPILENHCYSCHGEGENKGKVSFDTFGSTAELMEQTDLWVHALKNIRAGLMPPPRKKRPEAAELAKLEDWIKRGPLKLDPQNPDPGRVTLRRLNRVEYRNTIRDLTGVDFLAQEEFPVDDTGYGFDTIADALSTSPLLLEKYMAAAETIVAKAVPLKNRVTPSRYISHREFSGQGAGDERLSLYDPADLTTQIEIKRAGTYRVVLDSSVHGSFAFDPGRAKLSWSVDGKEIANQEVEWRDSFNVEPSVEVKWAEDCSWARTRSLRKTRVTARRM